MSPGNPPWRRLSTSCAAACPAPTMTTRLAASDISPNAPLDCSRCQCCADIDLRRQCPMNGAFVRNLKQFLTLGIVQRPLESDRPLDAVDHSFACLAFCAVLCVHARMPEPHRDTIEW